MSWEIRFKTATIGMILALGLAACSQFTADRRVTECKKIAEYYSPIAAYQAVEYSNNTVTLKLKVQSAIKELDGDVSCNYSVDSELPVEVRIGNTTHNTQVDIEALINGKYLNGEGLPLDSH